MMNFKDIYIGELIKMKIQESGMSEDRIFNFFKLPVAEIEEMYNSKDISVESLLKWSKLLGYDFFRLYSHHLILYSPPSKTIKSNTSNTSSLPIFRKNVYSQELIDFILEQISNGEMTKNQIVEEYRIPKTTLFKWILKYSKRKVEY
ncbi:transposase [Chryseobacterium sp. NRRL B-14859]|uniref:transposase n=1 Tax=Chryseobacterium sp. NRRL B-14859 TaxID=1562763 RepID=UPI00339A928D